MHLSSHEVSSLLKVPSPFSTAVLNEVISLHLKPKRRLIIYATDKSKWILNNQKIRAILEGYWEATVAHNLEFADPFEPPEWRSQWVERIK